jgi:hypothetical protein
MGISDVWLSQPARAIQPDERNRWACSDVSGAMITPEAGPIAREPVTTRAGIGRLNDSTASCWTECGMVLVSVSIGRFPFNPLAFGCAGRVCTAEARPGRPRQARTCRGWCCHGCGRCARYCPAHRQRSFKRCGGAARQLSTQRVSRHVVLPSTPATWRLGRDRRGAAELVGGRSPPRRIWLRS